MSAPEKMLVFIRLKSRDQSKQFVADLREIFSTLDAEKRIYVIENVGTSKSFKEQLVEQSYNGSNDITCVLDLQSIHETYKRASKGCIDCRRQD
jgi:hypothetical protein